VRYSRAMRALTAVPLILSLGCGPAAPAALSAPPPSAIAQEADAAARPAAVDPRHAATDGVFERFDKPGSPGCALSVTQDGQIVYARGYGAANLDHEVKVTPSSIFHVASISKQFTAFAVLLLAKQGKLSIDDDIRKYVPEVPDFGHRITLRHLLHHTSGLRDQWALLELAGWRQEDIITDEDVLDLVGRQRELNFKPGDEHLYSNTGYTLLAITVKRVSGMSLRDFTEDRIFRPLGMSRTHFHDDHGMIVKGRAHGYVPRKGGGFRISIPGFDTVGASSLFTTAEDLARWEANFLTPRVGDEALLRQMHERGRLNGGDEIPYALALVHGEHRGKKTVGHGGADAGYRADFLRFPEQRLGVIVLCGLSDSQPWELSRKVADIWLGPASPAGSSPEPAQGGAPPAQAEDLMGKVGIYWNEAREEFFRFETREGKLFIAGDEPFEVKPLGPHRFRLRGSAEIVFGPRRVTLKPSGQPARVYEKVDTPTLPDARLKDYAGTFWSEELGVAYQVALKDGQLVLQRRKSKDRPLVPTVADRFVNDEVGAVSFTREARRRVTGFLLSVGRIRRLKFTRQGG
jgi:CubicO group peptidase (beta-lactamase class C family)